MSRKPSLDKAFLAGGRFSLNQSPLFPKDRAAPEPGIHLRREPVTQPSAGTPEGSLQFDHVDRDGRAPALACAVCSQSIATSYYEVNGHVTCQRCRSQALAG